MYTKLACTVLGTVALLLPACDQDAEVRSGFQGEQEAQQQLDVEQLEQDIAAAAERHDVPEDVLMAVLSVEPQNTAAVPVVLHDGLVEEAAQLADLSLEAVVSDRGANLMAAAAWMSAYADDLEPAQTHTEATWDLVVAEMSDH